MGLIAKLKGVVEAVVGAGSDDEGTAVPVEREPDAANERAVKGVEADDGPGPSSATDDEPATPETGVEDESAAAPADEGEPVDVVKGIGSAYAERLAEAGVHTVADLAEADPEALDAETGIGAGRLGNWIERARVRQR